MSTKRHRVPPWWPSSREVALHFFLGRPLGFPDTAQGQYGSYLGPARISGALPMSVTAPIHSQSSGLGGSQPDAKEGSRAEKTLIPCSIREMAVQCHLLSISHPAPSAEDWLGASYHRAVLAVHKFPRHSWLSHLPAMAVIYHVIHQSLYPDCCFWPQV